MTLQPIPGAGVDPGDQPQRSVLAWRRTVLALVGVGLVLAKVALGVGHPVAVVAAVVAEVCAVASFVSSQRRLGDPPAALSVPPSPFLPLLLACAATASMAAAVLVLVLAA